MAEHNRESMDYDVVIVGAGPAGLSAAIRLKQLDSDLNVVVLEKGRRLVRTFCRAPFWTRAAWMRCCPNWRDMDAPITVEVTKDSFYMLGAAGRLRLPNIAMPRLMSNHGNYVVSMGQCLSLDGRGG